MGGLGTGASFHNNFEALAEIRLNMSALHNVSEPETSTKVLGFHLAAPIMAAPIGGVSFNMTDQMSEDDYVMAVLAGRRAAVPRMKTRFVPGGGL